MRGKAFKPKWRSKILTGEEANLVASFFRITLKNHRKSKGSREYVVGVEVHSLEEPVKKGLLDMEAFSVNEIYEYVVKHPLNASETSRRIHYARMNNDRSITIYCCPPEESRRPWA